VLFKAGKTRVLQQSTLWSGTTARHLDDNNNNNNNTRKYFVEIITVQSLMCIGLCGLNRVISSPKIGLNATRHFIFSNRNAVYCYNIKQRVQRVRKFMLFIRFFLTLEGMYVTWSGRKVSVLCAKNDVNIFQLKVPYIHLPVRIQPTI